MSKAPGLRMAVAALGLAVGGCKVHEQRIADAWNTPSLIDDGQQTFRYETFNDELFWTDRLGLNVAIEQAVDPTTARALGLKLDADAVPPGLLETADLRSPATTVALLKADAVVGLVGRVVTGDDGRDTLDWVGVTCALCHSTVDDSVASGVGHRLDGWPNRELDPGALIALAPALTDEQRALYRSWGPGRYDPRYNIDGQSAPVMIPPTYGLRDVPWVSYTGDGDIRYWSNFEAATQLVGQGNFTDERANVYHTMPDGAGMADLVVPALEGLRAYQFSLDAPAPPAGSFDAAAADRGRQTFEQRCGRCHEPDHARSSPDLYTPTETGMDPRTSNRSATMRYRATPLRALWQHAPYYHDGTAGTLADVVAHDIALFQLPFTADQKADLVEYLKSL